MFPLFVCLLLRTAATAPPSSSRQDLRHHHRKATVVVSRCPMSDNSFEANHQAAHEPFCFRSAQELHAFLVEIEAPEQASSLGERGNVLEELQRPTAAEREQDL
ncbi:hypothetical protein BHE74_00016662 [Ensete ventricosum]|uniref:Secreted protein n=1 Tax=Ensete ventricosum TaxID=4639 RepID=A0A427A9D7_ENSVE|nr:hypothetical protein B296_00009544 [Ensete ventricosum]RWW75327.1 hypothetical protein BHE74_00016662 [Ensete ventricosum]